MSSAKNPYWTHMRVRKDTLARLRAWQQGLDRAREKGQLDVDPGEQGWSFDQLVNLLLDRSEAHRERSKRSRSKPKDGPTQQVVSDLRVFPPSGKAVGDVGGESNR